MPFALLFNGLVILTCLLAWQYGGWAERMGASAGAGATFLTFLLTGPISLRFKELNLALVFIDVAALVAFLVIARLSAKFWPIWAFTLQILTAGASAAHLLRPSSHAMIYAINEQIWAWVIQLMICWASLRHPAIMQHLPTSSGRRAETGRRVSRTG